MGTTTFEGADGLRLVGDEAGPADGPAVLLLHGGGQTRHSWHGTAATLAERGWHAISLDLRGHGDSDWDPDADYTREAFAADITAVARRFDPRPALVGASLGGISAMIAIAAGGGGTEVASSLVLVDIAHKTDEAGRLRIRAFMAARPEGFADLEEVADAIAAFNPHRPRPTDLSGLHKNVRQRPDGRYVWHWDPRFLDERGHVDEARSTVEPAQLEKAAASLRLPTLLVRGRSSDLLTEDGAQAFLDLVPHAEFADVAGAGHMVAGDRNDVFNRSILEFLERHRPAG
ncbi:MAG: alpha/beta fold hydrolase [Acidimicrobiia bacterium]